MKHKKITTILFSLFAFLIFTISCSESSDSADESSKSGSSANSGSNSNCPTKTCGSFKTQAEAQAAYNSNKSCYKNLDGNGDGIACESLK
ncbi:excalibur calcium-binding domain-containing protein [Flavobacterium soyae]|uniref:excalibur calcium-binding domain-containing protein n=1 Tax=Flavobacterium soyae TaxID=2903098 RepID=UPI001E2FE2A8|nr:excalibur calcium-binding domain-containing protein [Flavobacterium soyae]MCD9574432.1 excalibur calcium-binding domain-containing protein [Flavobacterium soyae]